MIKAIFIDFYGTVVFEDGEIVSKISKMIYETGNAQSVSQVDSQTVGTVLLSENRPCV